MTTPEPTFICLEHEDVRNFVQQDFSEIDHNTTAVLRIEQHEIHVSRHPVQPVLFTAAVKNTQTSQFTMFTSTDLESLPRIATRLVEAIFLSYLEHTDHHSLADDPFCIEFPQLYT